MMRKDSEAALLELAARQHLAFTASQALDLGLSSGTLNRRVAVGRWMRPYRGVYLCTCGPVDWRSRVMAAVLACGSNAYASHRSAAAVWGLLEDVETPEVTVPHRVAPRHRGIMVHRTLRVERARHEGFMVCTPMRSPLDLSG